MLVNPDLPQSEREPLQGQTLNQPSKVIHEEFLQIEALPQKKTPEKLQNMIGHKDEKNDKSYQPALT